MNNHILNARIWRIVICWVLTLALVLGFGVSTTVFAETARPESPSGEPTGQLQDTNLKDPEETQLLSISDPTNLVNVTTAKQDMQQGEVYSVTYPNSFTYRKQPVTVRVKVEMINIGGVGDRYQDDDGNYLFTDPNGTDSSAVLTRHTDDDGNNTYTDKDGNTVTVTDEAALKAYRTEENEAREKDPLFKTQVWINASGRLEVDWNRAFNTQVKWTIETLHADGSPFPTNLATGILDPDESNYIFPTENKSIYYMLPEKDDDEGAFATTFYVYGGEDGGVYPMRETDDGLHNTNVDFSEGKILVGMEGDPEFTFTTATFSRGYLVAPYIFKITFKANYVSDEGGTITGLETEELDDGDNPTGSSQQPKGGYKFTGWTADVDVTLDDGTVIPTGTVLTEDQIKRIEMDKDITFTANHELIPALEMTKSVDPAECSVGDTVTYTVTLKQTVEGAKARDIEIKDVMDEALELDADSFSDNIVQASEAKGGITANAHDYSLTIDELSDSITWTYQAKVTKGGTDLANTVTADTPDIDEPVKTTTTVDAYTPDPYILKTADVTNAKPGDTVTYTIKMGNNDKKSVIRNAVMTDPLPKGLTFVPGSLTVDDETVTVTEANGTITATTDELTDEVTVTYKAKIDKDARGPLKNTATLTGDNIDKTSGSVESSATVSVPRIVITSDDAPLLIVIALAALALIAMASTRMAKKRRQ